MPRILVVEDCQDALELARRALAPDHDLTCACDLASARRLCELERFDLALIDLGLPDGSGLALCSELQAQAQLAELPVIVLTASDETRDKVMAFQLGADDYVAKPFRAQELRARVESKIRKHRSRSEAAVSLRIGDLTLDAARYRATIGDGLARAPVDLTPHEFRLLRHLAERPGQVVPRDQLLASLWSPVVVSPRTIDTHVSNLRCKLAPSSVRIEPVRGVGYRLEVGSAKQS